MASTPIPVKLPIPPPAASFRQNQNLLNGTNAEAGSIADRALAALDDEDAPSSLDVHIRWTVESGSIVRKGESIAQLFYSLHGSPSPSPPGCASSSANNGNAMIRARTKKKKRWAVSTPSASAGKPHNVQPENGPTPNTDKCVSLTIKAAASGFVRMLYTKPLVLNAVQINRKASPKYSVINLILAAIEPCEHPAVVGGLCVVCGVDTRAPKESSVRLDEHTATNPYLRSAKVGRRLSQNQHLLPKKTIAIDAQQQQIIETQRKLAADMAALNEFDGDSDDEFACFDMDAAIASHAKGSPPSTATNLKASGAPTATHLKSSGAPKAMRSLSSLLSGAKATHNMQQLPPQQKQPRQHHLYLRKSKESFFPHCLQQARHSCLPPVFRIG